jgi:hypothetical protein
MNGFAENNFTTMANARVAQRIEMSGRQYLELLNRFVNITGPTGPACDTCTGPTGFTGYTGYTGYTGPTGFSNTGPNPTFETLIIDSTNTEALLVRRNGDTRDILRVNTTDDEIDFLTLLTIDNTLDASTGALHVISNSEQAKVAELCRVASAGVQYILISDSSGNGYRERGTVISGGPGQSSISVWDSGTYYIRLGFNDTGAAIDIPGRSMNTNQPDLTWEIDSPAQNGFDRESATSFSMRISDTPILTVSDADLVATVPTYMPTYTVAGGLPAGVAGQLIYVSDETGGPVTAYYDSTNWRRMSDGVIVS